jgi:exoribonuclease II
MVLKAATMGTTQERPRRDSVLPPLSPAERRRETRYPANDPVEIYILEAASNSRFAGTVVDVSRSGLRVEVATPISKGARVEVILPDRAIIFGETRYCRRSTDCYYIGIAIEDVYYAQSLSDKHIADDQLSFYLVGKGLTTAEAINIKSHLVACKACRDRMAEAEAILRPTRKQALPKPNDPA